MGSDGDRMKFLDNALYREDINYIAEFNLPWEKLQDKSILISGASGLIASCLIDVVMSSFIFPLITFPYVSRILLPAGTGKVSFATSVVSYFAMFA